VSCSSPVACMAAGGEGNYGPPEVARWNGRAWSGQTIGFNVTGLSCVSRTVCAFVGSDSSTTGKASNCAIAGFWTNGRWSRNLALPCRSPRAGPQLFAVSCSSASACIAVGTSVYGWNGQRWTLERNALHPGESFQAVSCVSRTACVAVGDRGFTGPQTGQALVKRWNGSRWSTVYVSKLVGSYLDSVSCISARVCRAVGSYYNTNGYTGSAPLVESNG
jgi:hypothetical protein